MAKGGEYERAICKELSLWWSDNETDNVFWRVGGSGGRATNRAKRGKKTKGQGGDVVATVPEGELFTRLFAVELKRGYNTNTFHSLIDKLENKKCLLLDWIEQAKASRDASEARSWMLVHRRDCKKALIYLPECAVALLRASEGLKGLKLKAHVHLPGTKLLVTTLGEFFRTVSPQQLKERYE